MKEYLYYDPGELPTAPAPREGESIRLAVPGWPPWKDEHFSIRNPASCQYPRFVELRAAARAAMNGRAWSHGAIEIHLTIFGPQSSRERSIDWYFAGVLDTLDGSHGSLFTYLPLVFEDDCQVVAGRTEFIDALEPRYEVVVVFQAKVA